jgi:hypothetical protein
MLWRTVDFRLNADGQFTNSHARLKSFIKGGRRAADRDTQPFRGFKCDQVACAAPKDLHRRPVLLAR